VEVTFVVEQAGCDSCADRLRGALGPVAAVAAIVIDEEADAATVRLAGAASEDAVGAALAAASKGSGHAYRVRPGSWRPA
jgi:copper chaperone CopZ